ncbi:MAG: N-acetylmuramoyl-L-alanine amidase [Acidobacteriota bacterium]
MLVALVVAVPAAMRGAESELSSIDLSFDPYGTIRWERDAHPVLLVLPGRGDGWISLAQRFAEDRGAAVAIRDANPRLETPMRGHPVRIPVEVLRSDLLLEAVERLFPLDHRTIDGWRHQVLDPFGRDASEETWEWLAALFTGRAGEAAELRKANPRAAAGGLTRGSTLVIPERLLLVGFRAVAPVVTPTPVAVAAPHEIMVRPTPVAASRPSSSPLDYGEDRQGPYAVYRLRKGEALYSAVVVRFTGQLLAKQVNQTAMEIAARSGIKDVTDIPIGYPVKIPLELLLPEYLPRDDPRRQAWVEQRRELAHFLEVIYAADLSGVQVILDAGHGGKDTGAVVDGVWEATYAYDIMCRIKANLERHTQATVWTTVEHGKGGCSTPATDRLQQSRNAYLLTQPRYRLDDSVLGVHLRWYLTNDIILNRLGSDVPRSKTVFLSVHADSLHPSVRGAMAYVPSRYLRPTAPYTVKRGDIQRFAEYRNHPTVRLGPEFKARVEASSRHLATDIVGSLQRNGIAVHPYDPVRDRVLRGRRSWVPAVLRYTAAQNAVLLECCNMANDQDRALLQKSAWREQFARAVVEGMAAAFSS